MPRTKGSKNKPKTMTADFATQIAEKQSAKEALTAEIASITVNIDTLKADLKEKKASLKAIDKEIVKLEAKKAKADAKAAEEAKKTEAEFSSPSLIWCHPVLSNDTPFPARISIFTHLRSIKHQIFDFSLRFPSAPIFQFGTSKRKLEGYLGGMQS